MTYHARLKVPLELRYCVDPDLLRWAREHGPQLIEVEPVDGSDDLWKIVGHGWLVMTDWLEWVELCQCEWSVVYRFGCQCGGE